MSKLFKVTLIILLLTYSVNALQDSNLTIQTYGVELCISADNITNQICDDTEVLTIDGTNDHNIYFTPKIEIERNATTFQQFQYGINTPMQVIIGLTGVILSLLVGIVIILVIYYAINR